MDQALPNISISSFYELCNIPWDVLRLDDKHRKACEGPFCVQRVRGKQALLWDSTDHVLKFNIVPVQTEPYEIEDGTVRREQPATLHVTEKTPVQYVRAMRHRHVL